MEKNIIFKGCRVINCEYKILDVEDFQGEDGTMSVGVKMGFNENDNSMVACALSIETNSFSGDEVRSVKVECIGSFVLEGFEGLKNADRAKIVRPVAISTIYPFLRTYVLNITNLDAQELPITLPIINLSKMK